MDDAYPSTHLSREIARLLLEQHKLERKLAEIETRVEFYQALEAELEKHGQEMVLG
jgi:hypothetical protein